MFEQEKGNRPFEEQTEIEFIISFHHLFSYSNLLIRYVKTTHSVVLDYAVNVHQLSEEDQMLGYGELGNFSVAGFEMVLNR